MSGGIIAGIIVGIAIAAVVVWIVRRQSSKFKSVITEFMEAGAAKNVEAAYACCSPNSLTKERIAELIKSSYDVFAGYERLTIRSWGTESSVSITGGHFAKGYASGAIIYAGGKRLPFTAQLVKDNDVWKITSIQIGSTAKWWRDKKKLAIVIGSVVVVGILIGTIVPSLGRFFSEVKPVITEFMEAGVARDVEAAYACWSPQSVTEEEIAEFIESSYDLFAGYERLTINIWNGQSSGGTTTCYVSGAVIYTGDQSLPLEASLTKESEVWKILGIQVGSTVKGIVTRPPPSHDDWDWEEW
jgi:hypothetical protein